LWLARPGAQVVVALVLWGVFAAIVYGLDPVDALARAGFFLVLFAALFFTLRPPLRALLRRSSRSRLYQEASALHATRQALMLAAFLVLNALMQMVNAWSLLKALLLLSMFAVIEVVALSRR
jgi:hypothetical protein